MASSLKGTSDQVDEFQKAFSSLVEMFTKVEENPNGSNVAEICRELDLKSKKFIVVARQIELFFLQKQFVLSALKPELIIKKEIDELKLEILRKDKLLERYNERIKYWRSMLNDIEIETNGIDNKI